MAAMFDDVVGRLPKAEFRRGVGEVDFGTVLRDREIVREMKRAAVCFGREHRDFPVLADFQQSAAGVANDDAAVGVHENAERPAAGVGEKRIPAAIRLEPRHAPVHEAGINPALSVESNRLRPLARANGDALDALQEIVSRIGAGFAGGRLLRLPGDGRDADGREGKESQDDGENNESNMQNAAHWASFMFGRALTPSRVRVTLLRNFRSSTRR